MVKSTLVIVLETSKRAEQQVDSFARDIPGIQYLWNITVNWLTMFYWDKIGVYLVNVFFQKKLYNVFLQCGLHHQSYFLCSKLDKSRAANFSLSRLKHRTCHTLYRKFILHSPLLSLSLSLDFLFDHILFLTENVLPTKAVLIRKQKINPTI